MIVEVILRVATASSVSAALLEDAFQRSHEQRLLGFKWGLMHPGIVEGGGSLSDACNQEVEYLAPATPGPARLKVSVMQREISCVAEALVTISATLETSASSAIATTRGLPGYTFERAAGELWRSRFDVERNLIIVNNGRRDFVFVRRNRALQLRYLERLYVKELVLRNFAGAPPEQLLERMIELTLLRKRS